MSGNKDIQDQSSPSIVKKRKFDILDNVASNLTECNTGLAQELDSYLLNKTYDIEDDKCDPWIFWNQQKNALPKLSSLALLILSIPLSIGAVQRVFSFAGHATSGRRNRLEGEHLEREVFLHKNRHLISFS